MRLFFAINFSAETKNRLIALRDELMGKSDRGNFSLPENLHLTLAFLGECNENQTAAAKAALDKVTFDPLEIVIENIGRFRRNYCDSPHKGDIWWAGVRENKALTALQRNLSEKLASKGFIFESRRYSPHITIGREVITDCQPWDIEPFGETAGAVDLMKSERIQGVKGARGKLTYTSLYKK